MRLSIEIAGELYHKYDKKDAKTLYKYGCNISKLARLQYDIEHHKKVLICTIKYYKRLPPGGFSAKAYETSRKSINVEFYLNTIISIPMFEDTTKKQYTEYGYIPMTLTCYSWGDRSIKKVTEFEIVNS